MMGFKEFVLIPVTIVAAVVSVFMLVPDATRLLGFTGADFLGGQVWRIFTFPFAHVNTSHLLDNVLALCIASLLAYEVGLSKWQYAVAMVGAVLSVALLDTFFFPTLVIVGLSSAIFAVYGAFAMHGSMFVSSTLLVPIVGATVLVKYGLAFVSGNADGVMMLQTGLHMAGFVAGIATMAVWAANARNRRMLS
jgi:membrane associated rhomboid family serine protease